MKFMGWSFKKQLGVLVLVHFLAVVLCQAKAEEIHFQYSKEVTSEQRRIIENDFRLFKSSPLADPTGELSRLFHLENLETSELESWLSNRAKIIIDANHPINEGTIEVLDKFIINWKKKQSKLGAETKPENLKTNIKTMMQNVGTSLYKFGKEHDLKLGLQVQGLGLTEIQSPRVGLIQIGEIFFSNLYSNGTDADLSDFIHMIHRITTLFHEARHSDGENSSLGFLHAQCPTGHDYEGSFACDKMANGPYRIGAQIMDSLTRACDNCSEGEKAFLMILRNDNLSRLLTDFPSFDEKDSKNCVFDLFSQDVDPCSNAQKKQIKYIEWDETPEGIL